MMRQAKESIFMNNEMRHRYAVVMAANGQVPEMRVIESSLDFCDFVNWLSFEFSGFVFESVQWIESSDDFEYFDEFQGNPPSGMAN